MDFQISALLLQDGVTMGAIYVLLAIALVMVFNVTRIVFVAQGEFVSFTALTLAVFDTGHLPGTVWLLLGVGVVAFAMDMISTWRSSAGKLCHLGRPAILYLVLPASIALLAVYAAGEQKPL